jgi:hypothetical protein
MAECHLCENKAVIFDVKYNYKDPPIFPLPNIKLCQTCHETIHQCDWCQNNADIYDLTYDPVNPIHTCKPKKLKLCLKCHREYVSFHRDASRYHF